MNRYRRTAMAVTTCAAGLSLAACSAGITTAKPAASPSAAASSHATQAAAPPPSPSRAPSSPSASGARTVRVNAPVHSFPIPAGVNVVFNDSCLKQVVLTLNPITPSRAAAFYETALPRAGYEVSSNISTGTGSGMTAIEFSGHGYTGEVAAIADLGKSVGNSPVPSYVPSDVTKNVADIFMSRPGVPDSYTCPG